MLHLGQTGVVALAHVVFADGHKGQVVLAQEHGAVTLVKFELGGHTTVMFCVTHGVDTFAHEDEELHNSQVKLTLSESKYRSTYPSGQAADVLHGRAGWLVQLHEEVTVELGQKNVTLEEKLEAGHVKFTWVGHKSVTFAQGTGCVQFNAVWFAQVLQFVMSRYMMVVRFSHEQGTVMFDVKLEAGHSVVTLNTSHGRVVLLLQIGQVMLVAVQLLVTLTCGQIGQVTLAVTFAHKLQFSVALTDGQIGQLAFTTVMFCTMTVRFSH